MDPERLGCKMKLHHRDFWTGDVNFDKQSKKKKKRYWARLYLTSLNIMYNLFCSLCWPLGNIVPHVQFLITYMTENVFRFVNRRLQD